MEVGGAQDGRVLDEREGVCTCSSLVIFSSSGKRMGAMCGSCWSVNSAQNSKGGGL